MPHWFSVPDHVDPAPRILRIVARCLTAEADGRALPERLLWTADVLSGAPMTRTEANRPLGRLLSRERRVVAVRARRATACRQPSAAHVAERQRLEAVGGFEDRPDVNEWADYRGP